MPSNSSFLYKKADAFPISKSFVILSALKHLNQKGAVRGVGFSYLGRLISSNVSTTKHSLSFKPELSESIP